MPKDLLYEESFMKGHFIKSPLLSTILRRILPTFDTVIMTQGFKFLHELSGTNHIPATAVIRISYHAMVVFDYKWILLSSCNV